MYLISVSFPLLLPHREAERAGTVERGGLGASCRRGMNRNKGWGGSWRQAGGHMSALVPGAGVGTGQTGLGKG